MDVPLPAPDARPVSESQVDPTFQQDTAKWQAMHYCRTHLSDEQYALMCTMVDEYDQALESVLNMSPRWSPPAKPHFNVTVKELVVQLLEGFIGILASHKSKLGDLEELVQGIITSIERLLVFEKPPKLSISFRQCPTIMRKVLCTTHITATIYSLLNIPGLGEDGHPPTIKVPTWYLGAPETQRDDIVVHIVFSLEDLEHRVYTSCAHLRDDQRFYPENLDLLDFLESALSGSQIATVFRNEDWNMDGMTNADIREFASEATTETKEALKDFVTMQSKLSSTSGITLAWLSPQVLQISGNERPESLQDVMKRFVFEWFELKDWWAIITEAKFFLKSDLLQHGLDMLDARETSERYHYQTGSKSIHDAQDACNYHLFISDNSELDERATPTTALEEDTAFIYADGESYHRFEYSDMDWAETEPMKTLDVLLVALRALVQRTKQDVGKGLGKAKVSSFQYQVKSICAKVEQRRTTLWLDLHRHWDRGIYYICNEAFHDARKIKELHLSDPTQVKVSRNLRSPEEMGIETLRDVLVLQRDKLALQDILSQSWSKIQALSDLWETLDTFDPDNTEYDHPPEPYRNMLRKLDEYMEYNGGLILGIERAAGKSDGEAAGGDMTAESPVSA